MVKPLFVRSVLMRKQWAAIPALFLIVPVLHAQPETPVAPPPLVREAAPSPLPNVLSDYERPDYWTGRHPDPEKVLLAPAEIERINRQALKDDPEAVDIFSLPDELDTEILAGQLSGDQNRYGGMRLFDPTNRPIPADYFVQLFSRMDVPGIPNPLRPVYGVITRETNLRVLPTDDLAMDKPFDYAFDRFQSEKLDSGTPLVVLHYTRDRSWCFVETGVARGWIRPNDAAIGKKEEVMKFARAKPLVVSADSALFFRDQGLRQFAFDLPMGARLPCLGKEGEIYRVGLPWRDREGGLVLVEGYVRADGRVQEGYLPYTMGAVLRQAFKLKDSRYSWGGLSEGRDCSRFIMDLFRCFGLRMPRDSYRQAVFSRERRVEVDKLSESEKSDLLRRYEGVPTILYMKGHVMLLLGVVDGRAYAIHSFWDYGPLAPGGPVYHVGRVVVSDLSLGRVGEGTLLKWISVVIPLAGN